MKIEDQWDLVDKIIYINLEEATERRANIEQTLSLVPKEKVVRFNAIEDKENPTVACSKSHIECIKLARKNNWNNVLVLEDDVVWNNYDQSILTFNKLLKENYDVILLGSTFANFDKDTMKLNNGQAASSYLVSNHYYEKIIENYIQGVDSLLETKDPSKYALDQNWKKLQLKDNWYVVNPALAIQKPSYSYIEKKEVNYTGWFNI